MSGTEHKNIVLFERREGVPVEEAIIEWLNGHELRDHERHTENLRAMEAMPKKEDIEEIKIKVGNCATKEDTKEILQVFKTVKTAVTVTESGGKWAYRFFLAVAALVLAYGVISGAWKGVLAATGHYLFTGAKIALNMKIL